MSSAFYLVCGIDRGIWEGIRLAKFSFNETDLYALSELNYQVLELTAYNALAAKILTYAFSIGNNKYLSLTENA